MFTVVADISLRIVVAAAAVGAVLIVLRVRSGAARHAAWSAVLLAMLTMPVVTAIVPRIDVPVPSTLSIDPGTVAARDALRTDWSASTDTAAPVRVTAGESARQGAPGSPVRSRPRGSAGPRFMPDLAPVLVSIYVAGALFFFIRLGAGLLLAWRLIAGATLVTRENGRPIFESAAVASPLTTGIVSPAVVLPLAWREWPAGKLRAVLAHEHAHIARRDLLIAVLASVNRAIFWFHPVAWWLERTLAINAEHACDETAARQLGEPRRYAEVLLDMAEAVHVRGNRVAWPALGVDGSGFLGTRIDRILRGDGLARLSIARRIAIASACAAVLLLAIACRQQVAATTLRPDPDVERSLKAMKARIDTSESALAMSVQDAAALEASLDTNPDNLEAREKLITFYRSSQKVKWDDKLAGLRKQALWLIGHAPESRIWVPIISKKHDPNGYAEAKRLWLLQTTRADASVKVIAAAADFLSAYDKPIAEELLLRGHKMDPESTALRAGLEPGVGAVSWPTRLGMLYARAIAGNVDQTTSAVDPEEAASPFAVEARRRLDATTDARILASAGNTLVSRFRGAENVSLGKDCLERALRLDPENVQVKGALANAETNDRNAAIEAQLRAAGARDKFDEFSDTTYAAVSALPDGDRLFYLLWAAEGAYMRAESIEFTNRDKPGDRKAEANRKAQAGWNRARQYAEDALKLAEKHPDSPEYGSAIYRANVALGVLALKGGDREGAVEHMARAGKAPQSGALRYSQYSGLSARLVEYLLREGERDSVVVFLEKSAALFAPNRDRWLKDAAQIRDGIMPQAYQFAEARR